LGLTWSTPAHTSVASAAVGTTPALSEVASTQAFTLGTTLAAAGITQTNGAMTFQVA
jgi:hypothetical protein